MNFKKLYDIEWLFRLRGETGILTHIKYYVIVKYIIQISITSFT